MLNTNTACPTIDQLIITCQHTQTNTLQSRATRQTSDMVQVTI